MAIENPSTNGEENYYYDYGFEEKFGLENPIAADLIKKNNGFNEKAQNESFYGRKQFDVDKITKNLCENICKDYKITESEELEEKVKDLLIKYKDGEINELALGEGLEKIASEAKKKEENTNTGGKSGGLQEEFPDAIVDIEPDDLSEVSNICKSIESSISGITLTIPGKVMKYASGVKAAAEGINSVSSSLGDFKGILVDTLNGLEDSDVDYDDETISWDEIGKAFRNISGKMIEAQEEFFSNYPDCEIINATDDDPITIYYNEVDTGATGSNKDNIISTKESYELPAGKYAALEVDGRKCYYNLETHNFYVNGYNPDKGNAKVEPLKATIYLPSSATDYSNLNTYTFFEQDGYEGTIKGMDGNAIGIEVIKNKDDKNKQIYPWDKYEEIGYMTKFVNKVADTKLKDGKCQNIVGGDSAYGTFAMKVASYHNQKDEDGKRDPLYNTVYCINNAIIAKGINNSKNNKQQMTQKEVENLDGLNVYFISSAGDPNLVKNKKKTNYNSDDNCKFNESYEYTGLVYLLATCPNTKVYMLYPPEEAYYAHNSDNEIGVYKTLQDHPISKDKYGNQRYFFNNTWLKDVALDTVMTLKDGTMINTKDYETHTHGNKLIAELINFLYTTTGVNPEVK